MLCQSCKLFNIISIESEFTHWVYCYFYDAILTQNTNKNMPEEESILNESNLFPLFSYGKILFAIKYFVTFLHLTRVIYI